MSFLRGVDLPSSPYRSPDDEDRAWERNEPARDYADEVTGLLADISEDASEWSALVIRGDYGLPFDNTRREEVLQELHILAERIKQMKKGA